MKNFKKKILYIADSTSIHSQRWINYFLTQGYRIYIITIGKKRQILDGVTHVANFHQFYYNSPTFITNLLKTRRIIRKIKPDILHAHFIHQYGWLGALSQFHPFILTIWGTDILKLPHASRGKFGKLLTQYTLKKADALTATSEAAKKEAISLGSDIRKMDVIFWGIDSNQFKPDIDTRHIGEHLSIDKSAPVILSNRNYAPLYNNDIVIRAMAEVLKHYPDAVLILQNAGGRIKGENELKEIAIKEGIEDSVRFLPQYDHNDLPPLYALGDIYVSVPSWDAGPVSLKEAMAAYCTPVISNLPGPMEWVTHRQNGMVVPVRDKYKLTDAICELLENRDMRKQFNEHNRSLIIEKAEHSVQMAKAEEIYKRVLNQSSRA